MSKHKQLNFEALALPLTDYPTEQSPYFFYKCIQRDPNRNQLIVKMGIKVHNLEKYQQDHILHLIQAVNYQLGLLKLIIVERTLVYAEISRLLENNDYDCGEQEGKRDRRDFNILATTQTILQKFIAEHLNSSALLNASEFWSTVLTSKITSQIVQPIRSQWEISCQHAN